VITLVRRFLFRLRGWVFCSCGTFALDAHDSGKLWLSWDGTAHSVTACGPQGNFRNWPVAETAVRL
jgi:hypothetical protein